MSAVLRRPITSGSRQAPDPYDQFLESRFLYRKHTARDASCLFRVIAEQMYDTQMLHYEVRLECVRFMTRKRRIFEEHVDGDFDAYLRDMTKPRTYGTLLELRAVCCMYRRNAILFEPFNMGSVVTYNTDYREHFMVFYTNEFHFDSVFHVDFIKEAAICQSICFKLLYKMLFKLPDVKYAVEAMLHPHTFDWGNYEVTMDARGYIEHVFCHDGRSFYLDTPENTSCILENYKLCNFHNSRFVDNNANKGLSLLYMCPNRYNSCVRQLIDDGITPFPYKVAKSLDTYMYRNVEFDSWNDSRKEAKRYNVYVNDYNFKIGAKCLVELPCDDGTKMYTCHIQKIYQDKSNCVVFVEHYGNKFVVPYVSLHPLPPDEFRPWAMPFRHRRHLQQRVHLSKHLAKPKQSKFRRSKVFDVTYFDGSKCDAMQYMDNYYGFNPLFHDEPQITEEVEQQPTTSSQQLQQQHKVLPKPSAEAGAGATGVSVLQQQQPASTVAPAQYVNYLTPSWINSDYQQSDGCMYMHYGGYAPPPPPPTAVSLQSQHPSLPPYGPAPFMIAQPQQAAAPPSTFVLPQFSSHSNSGANSYHNSCTNSIAGTSGARGHDDRSLYSIGEDLPANAAADVVTLQPYYCPDMHKATYTQDEQMRLYTNHNVHNFASHNYHNNTDQQLEHNDGLTTPPPTPDVASTSAGIKLSGGTENERSMPKRNANLQKVRPKAGRPEPLIDLGKAQHLAQASMLPTPSPSPNTQGNKFVFYSPPAHTSAAAQAAYQPPAQMPASTYYAPVKAGHNPYAWPPMPPPTGAVNMFGVPCDVYNNYSPEQNGAVNAANYAPPRH